MEANKSKYILENDVCLKVIRSLRQTVQHFSDQWKYNVYFYSKCTKVIQRFEWYTLVISVYTPRNKTRKIVKIHKQTDPFIWTSWIPEIT